MEKSEILRITIAVRALINKGWTKEDLAVDKDDEWANPYGNKAVKFSLDGALRNVVKFDYDSFIHVKKVFIKKIRKQKEHNNMIAWNDSRNTKKEVLEFLDEIMELCNE